eukprot:Pgem_evm1s586
MDVDWGLVDQMLVPTTRIVYRRAFDAFVTWVREITKGGYSIFDQTIDHDMLLFAYISGCRDSWEVSYDH